MSNLRTQQTNVFGKINKYCTGIKNSKHLKRNV